MQLSDIPRKLAVVWASMAGSAYVRQVPTAPSTQEGAASYTTGFPPETFVPVAAGGTPPNGSDMNGALNDMSAWARWVASGGAVMYDPQYAAAIGGYANAARLVSSTRPGLTWVSTIDNNTSNPDVDSTNWRIEGLGELNGDVSVGHAVVGPLTLNYGAVTQQGTSGTMPVGFEKPFLQRVLMVGATNSTGGGAPSAWAGVGNPTLTGMVIGQSVSGTAGGAGRPAPAGTAAFWWAIGI
jgi:hypothetical protein